MKLEIRAAKQGWRDRIELFVVGTDERGSRFSGAPITMTAMEEAAYLQPTANIDATSAQQLMDDLWMCGLRPSEGAGSAGALAATQSHLKDMQRITFGLLRKHGVQE